MVHRGKQVVELDSTLTINIKITVYSAQNEHRP
jgi:hypothetical protein